MESREGLASGVAVIGGEAPPTYHAAPRTENSNQISPVAVELTETKKRGRPRKYGPDGSVLSPMPTSSSAPPAGYFSSGKSAGEWSSGTVGTNFTPHVINVNAGEDVTMKVRSFSQQGPRAICILSANGIISNVTLCQPDSSGGTLTYEGQFEILSLSSSFMPTESQGSRSRSGGMSVSLASPEGRAVGGGVAGLLIAASPIQIVVGSFLPGNHQGQKPNMDSIPVTVTPAQTIAVSGPVSNAERDEIIAGHVLQNSSTFQNENWIAMQPMSDMRNSGTDINISLPEG